jgi:hypothetical protein
MVGMYTPSNTAHKLLNPYNVLGVLDKIFSIFLQLKMKVGLKEESNKGG